ncbi:MAG TPA: hypothetical protein VMC80_01100 [Patescibacteria group bacterium]|nr:hypothetical protein [Patescibacteria group bacterium]
MIKNQRKYQISGIRDTRDYCLSWKFVHYEITEANQGNGNNGNKIWDKRFKRKDNVGVIYFTTDLDINYPRLSGILAERGLVLKVLDK